MINDYKYTYADPKLSTDTHATFLPNGIRRPHTATTATTRIATSVITLISEAVTRSSYLRKKESVNRKSGRDVTYMLIETAAVCLRSLVSHALQLNEHDKHQTVYNVKYHHEPYPEPHLAGASLMRHKDAQIKEQNCDFGPSDVNTGHDHNIVPILHITISYSF